VVIFSLFQSDQNSLPLSLGNQEFLFSLILDYFNISIEGGFIWVFKTSISMPTRAKDLILEVPSIKTSYTLGIWIKKGGLWVLIIDIWGRK
jgi:hypothetical protein